MLLTLAAAFLYPPNGRVLTPLDLGTLTVAEARRLDGRAVLAVVVAEVPPFTHSGRAVVGFAPAADGTERGAVLDGTAEAQDLRVGQLLVVAGRLDVIDHSPAVINGQRFVGFVELRITGRLADR